VPAHAIGKDCKRRPPSICQHRLAKAKRILLFSTRTLDLACAMA
jgi:hypothetical protein